MFAKTLIMKIYHITTNHFLDRLWFKDIDDFKAAMNYVAVVSSLHKVKVLAFILMSNHVHIVLYCSEEEAKAFIDTLKKLYGIYYARKYNVSNFFRRVKVNISAVEGKEAAERAIAYVQMNCVAANICPTPFFYPWGTGSCFFNENPEPGIPLESLSRRAQIKLIKSNVKLPSTMRLSEKGYILPESYVNVKGVESLFQTSKRYDYFMRNSSKASKALERDAMPSFSDQTVLASANDLCMSLFRTKSLGGLTRNQKSELLKQLRQRFSSDINQLCRVIGLSYEEAAELLAY